MIYRRGGYELKRLNHLRHPNFRTSANNGGTPCGANRDGLVFATLIQRFGNGTPRVKYRQSFPKDLGKFSASDDDFFVKICFFPTRISSMIYTAIVYRVVKYNVRLKITN